MCYVNRSQFGHVTHLSFPSHIYSHPFDRFFKVWPLSPKFMSKHFKILGENGQIFKKLSKGCEYKCDGKEK